MFKKKWLYNVQKMKDVIRSPKQFGHISCSYLVDKTYVGTTLITYKTEHFCLESDLVYLEKYIKKKQDYQIDPFFLSMLELPSINQ